MKIGIVTFHRAANYGAVLQAYALQTFLKQAGYAPYFIDHHHGIASGRIRKYAGRSLGETLSRWAACRRRSAFDRFRRRYLEVSERSYLCEQDLTVNPPAADAYICGSDQIWNPNYLIFPKDERAFFLDFGPKETRRIAYAASLGVGSMPSDWSDRFAQHLRRFDSVSIREKYAVHMLNELERPDAVWVPDPTLLLNAEVYENELHLTGQARNIVFSYTLDRQVPAWAFWARQSVCECLSLPCEEAYERNPWRVMINGVQDPCLWLSSLKTSQFVVTNSYHGTIFSLLFRRPFIVLSLEGASAGMNGRLESLLGRVGLEDRLVTQFDAQRINRLCLEPIDWGSVEERISVFASFGARFLQKALSSPIPVSSPSQQHDLFCQASACMKG